MLLNDYICRCDAVTLSSNVMVPKNHHTSHIILLYCFYLIAGKAIKKFGKIRYEFNKKSQETIELLTAKTRTGLIRYQ